MSVSEEETDPGEWCPCGAWTENPDLKHECYEPETVARTRTVMRLLITAACLIATALLTAPPASAYAPPHRSACAPQHYCVSPIEKLGPPRPYHP